MIRILKEKVLAGHKIKKSEASALVDADLKELSEAANEIRERMCGGIFDFCSIINGKSGKCSENCKYCAQSSHYETGAVSYPLTDDAEIIKQALGSAAKKIARFSVVTSGKNLSDAEIGRICSVYKKIKEISVISLCSSNGLLSYEQLVKLKTAGVTRYHCNLETSRNNFKNICTSHTYDDKINTIKAAKKAGLEICSGCIIGMGETFEDRIDLMLDLRELEIDSVPVNVLNPIKGTPFEQIVPLCEEEVCRSVAIARFILPKAVLRLAGGRGLFKDKGEKIFLSGANAAISGDMLTTGGISAEDDVKIISRLGFETERS